jgi:hypothetical protein
MPRNVPRNAVDPRISSTSRCICGPQSWHRGGPLPSPPTASWLLATKAVFSVALACSKRTKYQYTVCHGPAAEEAGFQFMPPVAEHARIIHAGIIENLQDADLVLCDATLSNPNVFFEYGIRVALNTPLALVADKSIGRLPFDTNAVNCHRYDSDLTVDRVEETVRELTKFISAAKDQTDNALWHHFGLRTVASMATDGSPEDAMLQLILSQLEGGGNPLFTPVRALSVDDIDSLRDGANGIKSRVVDLEVRNFRAIEDGMFAFRLDLPPRKGLVRALVEIVSRVRHPSLISYFDVREDRGYIFRTDDGAYN